jgi:hypothetical protein
VLKVSRDAGTEAKDLGCYLSDGCNVNGVKKQQLPTGGNVWAMLREHAPLMLRRWSVCHRLNLCLEAQWQNAAASPWLEQLDAFFHSVARCLEISPVMQDELSFFACLVRSTFVTDEKHNWSFAGTRWNSRKPLLWNLAGKYYAWIVLCQRNSKRPGDNWAKYVEFLKNGETYLKVHMLADVLEIFDGHLERAQICDPLRAGASDCQGRLETLRAELKGYLLTPSTHQQCNVMGGHLSDSSIVRRALCECQLEPGHFLIQKGLRNVGWTRDAQYSNLKLRFDPAQAEPSIDLGLTKEHVEEAYKWAKSFLTGLDKSLKEHNVEEKVWLGLGQLARPDPWRREALPDDLFTVICGDPHMAGLSRSTLEQDWIEVRPVVWGLLGPPPPGEDIAQAEFRGKVLLPALAQKPDCLLARLLVSAALTNDNCAELERDLEVVLELRHHRSIQLSIDKFCKQMRMNFNEKARAKVQPGEQCQRARKVVASIRRIRAQKEHRDGKRNTRKERSDTGQTCQYQSKRRRVASHLTVADQEAMTTALDTVHAQLSAASGPALPGRVSDDVLNGL